PLGAVCDATAATDECEQGVCLPLSSAEPTNGVCTMACRPATLPQCGWSGPPDDVSGICLSTADEGPADLGICGATCNCNEECAHPDFVCIAQPSLEDFGARGICLLQSEDEPEPGIETCPTGGGAGAGGAAGMGGMGGGAGAPGGAAGAAGGGMGGAAGQGAGGTAGGG
ncbi:MAG TPA: hypothetical protein VKZ49_19160, partial [Polyangiaceae bacterium]|nr:hypothetical protein [Polyangiaceae bacterium]